MVRRFLFETAAALAIFLSIQFGTHPSMARENVQIRIRFIIKKSVTSAADARSETRLRKIKNTIIAVATTSPPPARISDVVHYTDDHRYGLGRYFERHSSEAVHYLIQKQIQKIGDATSADEFDCNGVLDVPPNYPMTVSAVLNGGTVDSREISGPLDIITFNINENECGRFFGAIRLRALDAKTGGALTVVSARGSRSGLLSFMEDVSAIDGVFEFDDLAPGPWSLELIDRRRTRSCTHGAYVSPGETYNCGDVMLNDP